MTVASFFFFLMGMMVKLCGEIPIVQVVFIRGFVAMFLCLIQLKFAKVSPWGKDKTMLITRGVCGTCALFLFFTTLQQLPFATAVTIQYLSPIFTTLLTAILLKEIFYPKQVIFYVGAFAGIILIKGFSGTGDLFPYVLGLGSAMFSAGAYTAIRKMKETEHPLVIIFYFPLIIIPVTLPFAISSWVTPSGMEWLYLLGVGVFVQTAQYFMTRAYQLGDASIVSLAGYFGLIWASLGGYFFFDELPTQYAFIGMTLVILSVVGNVLYRRGKHV
ncbi:hypothetical protein A9Q84_18980 [Halobacteriovorax marinus]|uniref:EamA domain-containing protein n=1 Tax=Halobacteriovorax marinus TaxID=97084 RepID=A0A1Y5F2Y8_9BACT|nr:hypothetical protein A9Q84_18980 [Halobacteriovorax marinus]